jgi:hypothetical protein
MGTGCFNFHYSENILYNNNTDNRIVNNPKQIVSFSKIVKIQSSFRRYFTKKRFKKNIKILLKKLLIELDEKKLLNPEIITKSKSEKFYQRLLQEKKIKPYSEYIVRNPKIVSKLKIMADYSVDIPYYIVNSSNEAYRGSWNLNKRYNGYGVIYRFNNITEKEKRIEGIFSNGVLNGYGRIIISDEEMLRGDFAFNKLNGLGEYHRKDGSIYSGSFYEGYPQGNGRETFKDGSFFEGFYIKGKKKSGKFEFKDKSYYQGNFEKDLFHGYGTYKWGNKKMYQGNWKEGKINGKGKLIYSDGSYYEGEFVNGSKFGKGKYVWNANYYYNGEWNNDIQNGYGILYKNGRKLKGFWENGKLKNEVNLNSNSHFRYTRVYSTESIKKNINKDPRLTYNDNIHKISNSKISEEKTEKDENGSKKLNSNYIRSSVGSVISLNSNIGKEQNDTPK